MNQSKARFKGVSIYSGRHPSTQQKIMAMGGGCDGRHFHKTTVKIMLQQVNLVPYSWKLLPGENFHQFCHLLSL